MSGNKEERELFEKRRQSLLEEVSALSYAEEKGVKRRNIEIAKNAIKNGFNDETIIKLTGLSIEEVKEIRKEQN